MKLERNKKMINLIKLFLEKKLLNRYTEVGKDLGDAISYSYMGQICGFKKLKKKFVKLQNRIVAKGYTPYTINQLVDAGGYGNILPVLKKEYNKDAVDIAKRNIEDIHYSEEIQNSPNALINHL